ncbi:MAG: hypothetical protein DRI36_05720, partial [Caldiserica bacterium]
FEDSLSLLDYAQYIVYSGPNKTGNLLKNWTSIFVSTNVRSYTENWSVDFDYLVEYSTNYVSVRVYDFAGNVNEVVDAFYILKDTTSAKIIDNQEGDDTWRNSGGTTYDVDFEDSASGLLKAEYCVWTGKNRSGNLVIDWSLIFETNTFQGKYYTDDWQVDFDALQEGGTNWISVRVYDIAGNIYSLQNDVFYIKKDITNPWIVDNQTGDDTVYDADPGDIFDVDFYDNISLDRAEYIVYDSTGMQGTLIKDWTPIFLNLGTTYYTQNWGVDFGALYPGYNYISVRVFDSAGSSDTLKDVFYVRKGAAPIVHDNQLGDDTWRSVNDGLYDVDFSSSGYALLDYFEVCAWTELNQSGVKISTWVTVVSNINAPEYTTDWGLPEVFWNSLIQGKNYVSVRVWDQDGKNSAPMDVFYVLKDTVPPSILDNQTGDNTWRNSNSGIYNVDFLDNTSLLKRIEYRICSSSGGNNEVISWTVLVDSINASSYETDWKISDSDFSLLPETTNYVSVRSVDYAGLISTGTDVFYILKDTTSPYAVDNQTDIGPWQKDNSALYDVDFYDTGGSKLDYFEVKACSSSGGIGVLSDWTVAASGINSDSYTLNWQLPLSVWNSLKDEATNYISVRVTDFAQNISTEYTDVFCVRKDTSPPKIINNVDGDDTWRRFPGTKYDVDFIDNGSGLDYIQYKVTDSSGNTLIDWTVIAQDINSKEYTLDWEVNFSSLICGYNYVSVRAADRVGNIGVYENIFYIKKDTETPTIIDNQEGDDTWRNSAGTTYDVDFYDDKSLLNYAQYCVYSGTGMTGTLIKDWTYIASGINSSSYTTDWQVDFASLENGINYVSVRVFDNLLNCTTYYDVFYVKKDNLKPNIYDNQLGDDTWRSQDPGAIYDVDFEDNLSLLDFVEYTVYSATGASEGGGELIIPWTTIASNISTNTYTLNWSVDFNSLREGKNYVTVRAWDRAGNVSPDPVGLDVFYILKDTTPPNIIDNQTGDDIWRNTSGTTYDIDFTDSGGSLLNYLQYKVTTSTGGVLVDWYTFASNISSNSYTQDFNVDGNWNKLISGYNYVSVKAVDNAGNEKILSDVFYIKKDTTIPVVV